jgi:hypothetical protein
MTHTGGCHCGAIRYEVTGTPKHVALCHCSDCRKSAGAPMVSWAAFAEAELAVTQGTPKTINSSGKTMRSFCPDCGSGLFYRNEEFLPGIVDIQSASFDDPAALPPFGHIQVAEQIGWMNTAHELPKFDRYPSQG